MQSGQRVADRRDGNERLTGRPPDVHRVLGLDSRNARELSSREFNAMRPSPAAPGLNRLSVGGPLAASADETRNAQWTASS